MYNGYRFNFGSLAETRHALADIDAIWRFAYVSRDYDRVFVSDEENFVVLEMKEGKVIQPADIDERFLKTLFNNISRSLGHG